MKLKQWDVDVLEQHGQEQEKEVKKTKGQVNTVTAASFLTVLLLNLTAE